MSRFICLFAVIGTIGCGASNKNDLDKPGGAGGEAGTASGGSGGSASGGSAGVAGNPGGSGGMLVGGAGGVGGEAGSAGGGGTGGVCVPKTCITIGVELGGKACGTVNDGCGNFIECNGCEPGSCGSDSDPNTGLPAPNSDGSQDPSTPNKCDGGCTQMFCSQPNCQGQKWAYNPSLNCSTASGVPASYEKMYVCTNELPPDGMTCVDQGDFDDPAAPNGWGTGLNRHRWCCQ